ncbi:hypothetical protein PSPO01_15885 [Paraphaeosphaeria sporulosa]
MASPAPHYLPSSAAFALSRRLHESSDRQGESYIVRRLVDSPSPSVTSEADTRKKESPTGSDSKLRKRGSQDTFHPILKALSKLNVQPTAIMSLTASNSSTAFGYNDLPTSGVYGIIEAMPGVRNVLQYCQLKRGETVVVLAEHTVDPVVVQAIAAGVVYHGRHVQILSAAPFAIGGMTTTNPAGLLSKILETTDLIADSNSRVISLHQTATISALATGARFPYSLYKILEEKMYSMLEATSERPYPYGGANFYSLEVTGIIVCVVSTATGVPDAPVKITVKDGIVTSLEGDREGVRQTEAFSPTGSYLRHALIGLNPKVRVAGGTQFEREKHSGSFYLGLDGLREGRPRLQEPGHAHNDIEFDVPTVYFDGKIVVNEGHLLLLDDDAIVKSAAAYSHGADLLCPNPRVTLKGCRGL